MKKNVLILVVLIIGLLSVKAQQDVISQQLQIAVSRLDTTKSVDGLQEIRNLFERIQLNDTENWLPVYYKAYTDIRLFFVSQDESWLEDAGKCLEELRKRKKLSDKERSEVQTLAGLLYYSYMSIDPAVNGPRYSNITIAAYAEALKLNPQNPRAIALNAFFRQSMGAFMGSGYPALQDDLAKARKIYTEENKATILPHWYMEF